MTVSEILKLAELGYTKEEIEKMGSRIEEPKKEEPKKEEPKIEIKEPETEPAQDDNSVIEQLMKQNKEMLETIKQMQADNAASARQPEEKKQTQKAL